MAFIENIPLQPPPPGQVSDFTNPESRGLAVVVVCYIFILIMWPIFLLRLYTKAFVTRKLGWDDGRFPIFSIGKILTLQDSLLHTRSSMFPPMRKSNKIISNHQKIGATAFAAATIWSINVDYLGPHQWDVRAIVLTSAVVKVETASCCEDSELIRDVYTDANPWIGTSSLFIDHQLCEAGSLPPVLPHLLIESLDQNFHLCRHHPQ